MSPAQLFRCVERRYLPLYVGLALAIIALAIVGRELPLRSAGRITAALVQGAAFAASLVLTVRSLRHLDEMYLRIHFEAIVLAFAATPVVITVWGFLESAGLPAVSWGMWIWPMMTGLWFAALGVVARRYR